MAQTAFDKEIWRSIKGSWGRFIAIFGIVALGVGFYAGLRMTAPDMNLAADAFYDSTNLMDIRVVSTMGMTEEDMQVLEEVYGEDESRVEDCEICFDHVTFSYLKKSEANIKDLSFCIKKGETLGIIGEIGSGKSTIINLMMRMYDVDEGRILISGKDVRSYRQSDLKKKFGVVFQNDTIFEDTIAENVTLGREISGGQLDEALFYARASEFVDNRTDKEGGALNIKGANLSGGQRQRVLIARALAARPEILILDDSSSALDYRTDAELRKGIKEHFQDTTLVIVAQRVSSIKNADHILVLEDGEPIGYGTHEELMEHCSVYSEISRSQMGQGV